MISLSKKALKIIQNCLSKKEPTLPEYKYLLAQELINHSLATAFNFTPENGLTKLQQKVTLLLKSSTDIKEFCQSSKIKFNEQTLQILWLLWLPLVIKLAQLKIDFKRPFIQGILGGQGTGKTTLTNIIKILLNHLGYTSVNLSLDDLYKTYPERQKLQQLDPRLIWRGPPCTHDLDLGLTLLKQLRQPTGNQEIIIPRFDKSAYNGKGDRIQGEPIKTVDIVLFEGWFVGVYPVEETVFNNPPTPIITPADIKFAKDLNHCLKSYIPLWQELDQLMIFYPVDYRFSKQWRKEAEHKMISQGKSGMSDLEIEQFVDYFWKALHPDLFIKPLTKNPDLVQLVIEIDSNHNPINIYSPQS